MNKFVDKLIKKTNIKFKLEIERQKLFFKKPDVLASLEKSSLSILNNLTTIKKSKNEIKEFLLKDNNSKIILKHTTVDFKNDVLNETLLNCLNQQENISELNITNNDFISYASQNNDIDKKTKNNESLYQSIKSQLTPENIDLITTYSYLLYHIIDMTIDLIARAEHPSRYRTKYIQKLIRNVYGLMKIEYDNLTLDVKKSYDKILKSLKQIDNIIIALTLATTTYILNRKKLQQKSSETLNQISADTICESPNAAIDVIIPKKTFEIKLDCPVDIDDALIPHVPIEEKLKNISCEIDETKQSISEIKSQEDLTTIAVIKNNSSNKINSLTSIDSHVTFETPIINWNNKTIFSPIEGYVDNIASDHIAIRDIVDSTQDYLTQQINLLNEKYNELNNTKYFLREYYIPALYPVMLKNAIIDDSSTYKIALNLLGDLRSIPVLYDFKNTEKSFSNYNKDYEKSIKKIADKDNVEKHAKNESLNEIKNDIEKVENSFFNNIKILGQKAVNITKKTKTTSGEFNLFEYYQFDLATLINTVENPNDIEITFKNKINEFANKRYVIDNYKKSNYEQKINSLIKDLEKGISLGNWFKKALDIYNSTKQISKVKDWLIDLANKNNKLDAYEKTVAVNKIVFLFEFYLQIDLAVQKYSVLKKSTTTKKETIIEGDWIETFFNDLWKAYNELPKQISEIEKSIDSLSNFTTYSITEYEGKSARLYILADKPTCDVNDENFIPSQYQYNDIQYWLRYCSFATLTSVINPATGWSTGWIAPLPIKFPVVYIPVKPITTNYGFILLGITICGIYIFPFVLFSNLSLNYSTPFGDPTKALKNEAEALKKKISEQTSKLKKDNIKKLMDETKIKIENKEQQIKTIKILIQQNKKDLVLREQLLALKTEKWRLTQRYSLLYNAYKTGSSAGNVEKSIEQTEKLINEQLDNLTALIEKIDSALAPLPTTLQPYTTNFGMTLKNPKPVIEIANNLDENINEEPLNKIVDKFELKNSDLMSSKYSNTLSNSIENMNIYKNALNISKFSMIEQDPFPKYQSLVPTNIPWMKFLLKDFTKVGAKTYGFPGQLPLPIG